VSQVHLCKHVACLQTGSAKLSSSTLHHSGTCALFQSGRSARWPGARLASAETYPAQPIDFSETRV